VSLKLPENRKDHCPMRRRSLFAALFRKDADEPRKRVAARTAAVRGAAARIAERRRKKRTLR
jgi:hypothetical protein